MTKNSHSSISRRMVLRGLGVGLTLPLLDAMTPACAASGASAGTQRLIAIQTNQGILPKYFFPKGDNRDYEASPYLQILEKFRDSMTVFSGVSHPEVDGGHSAEKCFLTAAPHPGMGGFRNSISVDQYAAERIGHLTRFPSLALSVGTKQSLSYTQSGVQIPRRRLTVEIIPQALCAGIKAGSRSPSRQATQRTQHLGLCWRASPSTGSPGWTIGSRETGSVLHRGSRLGETTAQKRAVGTEAEVEGFNGGAARLQRPRRAN